MNDTNYTNEGDGVLGDLKFARREKVVSGQWSVVSGQWAVGSGQWSVVSVHGRRAVFL